MNKDRFGKLTTLLSLYTAQAIPMSFFTTVIPVIMRQQHYSLEAIGLMQLVKLPWVLKFLWAPYVDKTGGGTVGYKRWIFQAEAFYAVAIASIAFFPIQDHFILVVVLMVLAVAASATQDIATDAWAILSLKKEERSLGNSMQSVGSFTGALLGSGVLLVVYHYLGWHILLLSLATLVLVALIPLALYQPAQLVSKRPRSKTVSMGDIPGFFRQSALWPHLLFLATFHASLIGIMAMVKPLLIDLGYNAREVGLIAGIFGTATGAVFALLAGIFMKKISRKVAALSLALLNLLPPAAFLLLSPYAVNQSVAMFLVALLWGVYAMGMVLVFTAAMDQVRSCREGTDFTLQIVVVHLGSLLFAVSSGKIAETFSYQGLFGVSIVAGLLALGLVINRFFLVGKGPADAHLTTKQHADHE